MGCALSTEADTTSKRHHHHDHHRRRHSNAPSGSVAPPSSRRTPHQQTAEERHQDGEPGLVTLMLVPDTMPPEPPLTPKPQRARVSPPTLSADRTFASRVSARSRTMTFTAPSTPNPLLPPATSFALPSITPTPVPVAREANVAAWLADVVDPAPTDS